MSRWRKVLWNDEATFIVTSNKESNVYCQPGSDPHDSELPKKIKFPDSIMVWGCFGFYGVGKLVVLPKNGRMKKDNYLELLCDHLPDSFEMCQAEFLIHSADSCHTARDGLETVRWNILMTGLANLPI